MNHVDKSRYRETRKLLRQLIKVTPDASIRAYAIKMEQRMRVPFALILDKVEGEGVIAKAKTLNVARQTVYSWLEGECRPTGRLARRIARLTGFSLNDVRGRGDAA